VHVLEERVAMMQCWLSLVSSVHEAWQRKPLTGRLGSLLRSGMSLWSETDYWCFWENMSLTQKVDQSNSQRSRRQTNCQSEVRSLAHKEFETSYSMWRMTVTVMRIGHGWRRPWEGAEWACLAWLVKESSPVWELGQNHWPQRLK